MTPPCKICGKRRPKDPDTIYKNTPCADCTKAKKAAAYQKRMAEIKKDPVRYQAWKDLMNERNRENKAKHKAAQDSSWKKMKRQKKKWNKKHQREINRQRSEAYANKHRFSAVYQLRAKLTQARLRAQAKKLSFDLTLDFLLSLLQQQGNKCPISGRTFEFTKLKTMNSVSIDRIDPTKGYTKDNVRLVTWAVNAARNTWSDDELLQLCQDIVSHNTPHEVLASSCGQDWSGH